MLSCCFALAPHRARATDQFDWQAATPASQGMSPSKLDALRDDLIARKTRAFLVIRNDKIVYEWYAAGQSAKNKQGTASLAKAVVGGMALAIAISDGRLTLDDPVARYVPQWKGEPRKAAVTLRQLGSHTSGLEDAEARSNDGKSIPHDKLTGWKGEFWKGADPPHDPFTVARDNAAVLTKPGEKLQYSNPGIAMLTYVVAAAYKGQPHADVRTLLRDRIMRPIGVPADEWSVGYGKSYTVDGLPRVAAWGGAAFTPRALARIGRLVLREGDWDGEPLLSKEAVRLVTTDAGLPGHCGMGCWTNGGGRYADLPRDAVWGAGAGDQLLLVIPSLQLIMVRNGDALQTASELNNDENADVVERYHDWRAKNLFVPVVQAIVDADQSARARPAAPAFPGPSPVISEVVWAPAASIVRRAKGSDTWPITWADDGDLYAAYGDGNGFEPFVEKKLSLGLAKISGGPSDFQGTNLRSPDIEAVGAGADGEKASGLVMIEGVLYMWIRNAANSQLAWSADHGKTWTRADWKWTTSFGCPTFLNFGRNYAGARDELVYVFSTDSDSAYKPSDRMVLARVPKDRLSQRAAYEFFVRLDPTGRPLWSHDIADRGAVFTNTGRCGRSGITYNAGIKRYLWCQVLPESPHPGGPRFRGGFGIYDAPEPWGPWTTAYYTADWDVGPGDTNSFPTKWMSPDGLTLHLVFSGDDCFSTREARLKMK
jgi:CubicO group peptidase (beta-lactamase class C family)